MICGTCNRPLGTTLILTDLDVRDITCTHCGCDYKVSVVQVGPATLSYDPKYNRGERVTHAWGGEIANTRKVKVREKVLNGGN